MIKINNRVMGNKGSHKSNKFIYFSLLLFIVSLSLFWDNSYSKIGFLLCTLATILVIFFDSLHKFKGLTSLLTAGYLWWTIIIILLILSTIGNVPSYNQFTQILKVILLIETIIIFGVGLFTKNRWNRGVLTKLSIYSSLIIIIWIGINEYEAITNITTDTRIGWSAGGANPNFIGIILGFFSTIVLYEFLNSRKKTYLIILFLQYAFMLMTGSKKVLIFLFGSIALLLIFKGKKSSRVLYLMVGMIILIISYQLIMNIEFLYQIMGVRIERFLLALGITGYEEDNSTSHRLLFIQQALSYWEINPVFGHGFQSFNYKLGFNTYSHNNFVEILVSFGLFGFTLFYSVYIVILYKLFRNRKVIKDAELFITLLTLQLITDIGVVSYYDIMVFYISIIGGWFLVKNKGIFHGNISS